MSCIQLFNDVPPAASMPKFMLLVLVALSTLTYSVMINAYYYHHTYSPFDWTVCYTVLLSSTVASLWMDCKYFSCSTEINV